MLACEHAHSEVVDLLVKRGARADLQDAQGFDAAYYADASGKEEVKGHLESAPSVATWDVGRWSVGYTLFIYLGAVMSQCCI